MNYIEKINKVIDYIINTAHFSSDKEKSSITAQLKDIFIGGCLIEYAKLIKKKNKKVSQKQIANEEDFINLLKEIKTIVGEQDYIMVPIKQSEMLIEQLAKLIGKNCSREYIRKYNNFIEQTFNKE
jgi:hypothetical protein